MIFFAPMVVTVLVLVHVPAQAQSTDPVAFISTRPSTHSGAPIRGTLPGSVPKGAIVLQGDDPALPRETRTRSCRDIYGMPPEVTYSGGPVLEIRYETSNGQFSEWQRESGACIRHHDYQRTSTQCPADQQGVITEQRKYDVDDDNVVSNDTDWQIIENTCAYYFVRTAEEFKTLACPANQQGQVIERRSYEVWSDNSYRNHGTWKQVSNTCDWFLISRVSESRNLTCPTNMKGELAESRSYEIWSDGSHRNATPWTQTVNTCDYYYIKTDKESETTSCPDGMTGSRIRERSYDLWSDDSKRNVGEWRTTSEKCTPEKTHVGLSFNDPGYLYAHRNHFGWFGHLYTNVKYKIPETDVVFWYTFENFQTQPGWGIVVYFNKHIKKAICQWQIFGYMSAPCYIGKSHSDDTGISRVEFLAEEWDERHKGISGGIYMPMTLGFDW